MTSDHSIDIRQVVMIGTAQEDYDELPSDIRDKATAALSLLQNNKRIAGKKFSLLTGNDKLKGIGELRYDEDGDTYRVYEILQSKEVIYVLDAGKKKSKKGGAIPQEDINRLEERRLVAIDDYNRNQGYYALKFEERAKRRKTVEDMLAPQLKPKGSQ